MSDWRFSCWLMREDGTDGPPPRSVVCALYVYDGAAPEGARNRRRTQVGPEAEVALIRRTDIRRGYLKDYYGSCYDEHYAVLSCSFERGMLIDPSLACYPLQYFYPVDIFFCCGGILDNDYYQMLRRNACIPTIMLS